MAFSLPSIQTVSCSERLLYSMLINMVPLHIRTYVPKWGGSRAFRYVMGFLVQRLIP